MKGLTHALTHYCENTCLLHTCSLARLSSPRILRISRGMSHGLTTSLSSLSSNHDSSRCLTAFSSIGDLFNPVLGPRVCQKKKKRNNTYYSSASSKVNMKSTYMNNSLRWTVVFTLGFPLRSVSMPRRVTWDSRSPGSTLTD